MFSFLNSWFSDVLQKLLKYDLLLYALSVEDLLSYAFLVVDSLNKILL